jgi:hypothetical protein
MLEKGSQGLHNQRVHHKDLPPRGGLPNQQRQKVVGANREYLYIKYKYLLVALVASLILSTSTLASPPLTIYVL